MNAAILSEFHVGARYIVPVLHFALYARGLPTLQGPRPYTAMPVPLFDFVGASIIGTQILPSAKIVYCSCG